MTKNLRLKEARLKAGLTQKQLADQLGVKQSYIAKVEGSDDFSPAQAQKIGEILGVSGEWIFHGDIEGDNITNNEVISSKNPSINNNEKGVPYYDVDFLGGFDLLYNSDQTRPSFYIDFLPFNDADFWVNVSGKSMGPLIAHGDIAALKRVEDWEDFLLEGEIYAIVTRNGFRTIKIIGAGEDKDHYTLIPYNKSSDYNNQSIPKRVITHVFRVQGAIKKFF